MGDDLRAVGSGSGKLILFGEHSAVHGHPAIGVSLPERTRVELLGPAAIQWDLGLVEPGDRDTVSHSLRGLQDLLPGIRERCGRVRISSRVARGVGFGSSAALCVALAGAALDVVVGKFQPEELWALAHFLERRFHGTPSGIDTGLAVHPGVSAFTPWSGDAGATSGVLPRCCSLCPPPIALVVGAVPRSASCGALVGRMAERLRSGDRQVRQAIDSLGAIATEACQVLDGASDRAERAARTREAAARVGQLATSAMDQLRALGQSDAAQDRLIQAGLHVGATGGRLSGAGAGGAFYLVFADPPAARRALWAVKDEAKRGGVRLSSALRVITL